MSKNDGGQAFPIPGCSLPNGEMQWPEGGMSRREYFAAHAPITFEDAVNLIETADPNTDKERAIIMAILCLMRFEYADAMLAERNKP